jgi:Domain of Unknown Function (DUF326)
MGYAAEMLKTYPQPLVVDVAVLAATIEALSDCVQSCTADVDHNLAEPGVAEMVKCIRLCLNCADVCAAALAVTSRQGGFGTNVAKPLLQSCVAACRSCEDECELHASMHAHCRVCGEACRRCEQACGNLLRQLG